MQLQRTIRLSVLLAAAVIMYRFSFSLPLFPPFLKYDASDVPIVLGGIAYGPAAGLLLEVLKNLLHALIKGGANPVGLAANVIAGALLVGGTTLVYWLGAQRRLRWLAIAAGAAVMALGMIPLNLYVFLPAHGMSADTLTTMAVSTLTPFNLVKGALNAGLALLFYERLAVALNMKKPRAA